MLKGTGSPDGFYLRRSTILTMYSRKKHSDFFLKHVFTGIDFFTFMKAREGLQREHLTLQTILSRLCFWWAIF